MIKRIIFILFAGLIIALGGLYIKEQPGFAVFTYGDFTIELELIYFYFYVVAAFIALYILFRFLGYLYRLPRKIHANKQVKRNVEIMQGLESSFLDADKFDWSPALRNATKHIKHSPIKAAQYSLAADYAHNAGLIDTRDGHIAKLRKLDGSKQLADSMEAQYGLDDDNAAKALTLLHEEEVSSLGDMCTLAQAYLATDNTSGLESILPKLYKHVAKAAEVQITIRDGLLYLIRSYDQNSQADRLADMWKVYYENIESNPDILHAFVKALCKHKNDILAEQIIKTRLSKDWDEELIQHYGVLKLDNVEQRIKQGENWLAKHKDSAGLLLALGHMCKQQKLWGKAKSYLESSLSRRPLAATYAELASIHEALDEPLEAQKCAKKGLHLATRL